MYMKSSDSALTTLGTTPKARLMGYYTFGHVDFGNGRGAKVLPLWCRYDLASCQFGVEKGPGLLSRDSPSEGAGMPESFSQSFRSREYCLTSTTCCGLIPLKHALLASLSPSRSFSTLKLQMSEANILHGSRPS